MNYQRIYDQLILKAQFEKRIKLKKDDLNYKYYENHHIIPESFYIERKRKGPIGWLEGNPDAKENKVLLTPEEHYLAHQLLVKIYPKYHNLIHAAILMSRNANGMRSNNKLYGWLKRLRSQIPNPPSPMKGKSSPLKGRKLTPAQLSSRTSNGRTGKPSPIKGRKTGPNKARGRPSPKKGKKLGRPSKQKGTIRGKQKNPESKITCPHCGRTGRNGYMKKYHFDNCKSKM